MSPSTTVRRAGVVTAGALALALGGGFTAAASAALPTVCPAGQLLSSTGKCIQKTVGSVVPPVPSTSGSGGGSSSGGGVTIPVPKVPLPLPTGSGSGSGSGSSGGSSGGSGGGITLPSLPSAPSGTGGGTGGTGGITGPTVPGSQGSTTATNDGSSVPGSTPGTPAPAPGTGGMLSPAAAYLPTSGILGFASFSSAGIASIPTSSNLAAIPSPLLAPSLLASQPASRLAAVQAPLLAAGEDAGRGGTMLAAFGGYALPGLLVVLATAVVGTVGAGNVRVWQARMAARRA